MNRCIEKKTSSPSLFRKFSRSVPRNNNRKSWRRSFSQNLFLHSISIRIWSSFNHDARENRHMTINARILDFSFFNSEKGEKRKAISSLRSSSRIIRQIFYWEFSSLPFSFFSSSANEMDLIARFNNFIVLEMDNHRKNNFIVLEMDHDRKFQIFRVVAMQGFFHNGTVGKTPPGLHLHLFGIKIVWAE